MSTATLIRLPTILHPTPPLPHSPTPHRDLIASPRPQTTVVLAISVDGKIADADRSPARFGSAQDKAHLESQISEADAVLFGAGTLRSYGTSLPISAPELLQQRQQRGQPAQPIHIVASASGAIDPDLRFFRQAVPRWLLTTQAGDRHWQNLDQPNLDQPNLDQPNLDQPNLDQPNLDQPNPSRFERVVVAETSADRLDWHAALALFRAVGIQKLAILGGGTLVASLLEVGLIDRLWITVCPLLLGGATAPTLVEGQGFLQTIAPRLHLLQVQAIDHEVFLHYQVLPTNLDG